MSKHTPGPWFFGRSEQPGNGFNIEAFEPGEPGLPWAVAQTNGGLPGDQERANAALICAAPKMLHALKEARVFIRDIHPMPGLYTLKAIEDAIREAEGREVRPC